MKEGINRYCGISYSGRANNSSDYDTKQEISYFFQKKWDTTTQNNAVPASYEDFFTKQDGEIAYLLKTEDWNTMDAPTYGMCKIPQNDSGNNYSVYKKEVADGITYYSPVAVNTSDTTIVDFNVSAGREYEYIAYAAGTPEEGGADDYTTALQRLPGSIKVDWDCWSLTELVPTSAGVDSPAIKKAYFADVHNVWLFKYDVETGDQVQNISKTEQKTLGQFPRFSHGRQNNITSSVSCYLGSEIINPGMLCESEKIPYSQGYVERLPWRSNLTTNQKVAMLQEWRKIVASKNPKLIKDRKGQMFIVQITSGSNKPVDNVGYQPDKINFSWTQIASTEGVVIVGNKELEIPKVSKASCGSSSDTVCVGNPLVAKTEKELEAYDSSKYDGMVVKYSGGGNNYENGYYVVKNPK